MTASTIALGDPCGHRAKSLGGGGVPGQFLKAFSGDCFGKSRKVLRRSWPIPVVIVRQPGKLCKVLVESWPVPGSILGRLPGGILGRLRIVTLFSGILIDTWGSSGKLCEALGKSGPVLGAIAVRLPWEIVQSPLECWPIHGGVLQRLIREISQSFGGSLAYS